MSTISIAVDPEVQAAFAQSRDRERQELGQLVSLYLKEGWANKNLVQVMKEVSDRAEQRGLTQEILDGLLMDKSQ